MKFFKFFFLFTTISFSQSNNSFADVKEYIPNIIIDLKYASNDNFVGAIIDGYESSKCLLTVDAIHSLLTIQNIFNKLGYSLKIYDAYRPQRSVNHFFTWSNDYSDTINKEVDMGSSYDFFGIESSHDYENISSVQKNNRKLLLDIMINNGFSSYPKEWWHYTLYDEPFTSTYFDFISTP